MLKWSKGIADIEYLISKSHCSPMDMFYNIYCPVLLASNTKNFMSISITHDPLVYWE